MTNEKLIEEVADILLDYKQGGGSADQPRYDVAKQIIPIIQADTQKAERKRIQEELEVAIKDGKLDISDGVLLWEIIQAVPSYYRLILIQLHQLPKATHCKGVKP